MAGSACRRGCLLLRTHLLGRNQIPNPCKLSRPMSSNIVNEKGHYPFDTLALLKKLKAKGVPSEHAKKMIEVIKEDLILSRFKSELKCVQEVIKNYLDMSEFESEAKEAFEVEGVLIKKTQELIEEKGLSSKKTGDDHLIDGKNEVEGVLIKKTQELIEEIKAIFESEMNNEAALRALLKWVQEFIEESKSNLDSSKFESEIKLLDGIKDILHSYQVRFVMKEAEVMKLKSAEEERRLLEEIEANLIEAKAVLFESAEEKSLLEDYKAKLIDANGGSLSGKARDHLIQMIMSSLANLDQSLFNSQMNTEANGAVKAEPKSPQEGEKMTVGEFLGLGALSTMMLLAISFIIWICTKY